MLSGINDLEFTFLNARLLCFVQEKKKQLHVVIIFHQNFNS